jgi:RimJ/RimL family protein N-acetyltransferase
LTGPSIRRLANPVLASGWEVPLAARWRHPLLAPDRIISTVPALISLAEKPTLEGELVLLRPVQEADASGLAGLDPETLRLTGSQGTPSLAALQEWYRSRAEHQDRLDLSIIEKATGEWAGEVVLNDLNPENRSCGFRILLAGPHYFDRGLGSEATLLILRYAFETVGIHRIELDVYAFNPRARHVYERIGFLHEGTKRQALLWGRDWVDAHVMAMLEQDWSRHRPSSVPALDER